MILKNALKLAYIRASKFSKNFRGLYPRTPFYRGIEERNMVEEGRGGKGEGRGMCSQKKP
jgi:hypothetical protein